MNWGRENGDHHYSNFADRAACAPGSGRLAELESGMKDTSEIAAEVDHSDIKNDLTWIQRIAITIFKIIGALIFVYVAVILVVLNGWILICIPCWPIFSSLITLSIGMFYLRKWAAVGISLLSCFFAFLFFSEPTLAAKWPYFIVGFLFMIPAVLTVTQWRMLVWRANQDGRKTLHNG
jgi:hypothetical protein